jgi:hypothetical protein
VKVSNSTVLTRFLHEKLAPAIQTAKEEPELFLNRTGQESAEVKLGSDTYEFSFEGWRGGVDTDRSFSSVWALRSRERARTGFCGTRSNRYARLHLLWKVVPRKLEPVDPASMFPCRP